MVCAVALAEALWNYTMFGTISIGDAFPVDQYTMRNGYQSAYGVPIYLDGQDYGVTAVFDEYGNMLNIIAEDPSTILNFILYVPDPIIRN